MKIKIKDACAGYYFHSIFGRVEITEACLQLQRLNPDPSSIFVEHDGDVKEVTKSLVRQEP